MQGGPGPQELFWCHPVAQDVAQLAVARALSGFAGFMLDGATRPVPPALPGLRRSQLAQGLAAVNWLAELL